MPKKLQASFTGGELDPKLHARVDLAKYGTGAARMLNWIVHPFGGASNRPGLEFVGRAFGDQDVVRLVEFELSNNDTCVLEFSNFAMRVIRRGVYVRTTGNVIYTLVTPYPASMLFDLSFQQSNDVLTITTVFHPPTRFSRFANDNWVIDQTLVEALEVGPIGLVGSNTQNIPLPPDVYYGETENIYTVTFISGTTGRESVPSGSLNILNDMNLSGFENNIEWDPQAGASSYRIYKLKGGAYGLIGYHDRPIAPGDKGKFVDKNFIPDTTQGLPQAKDPYAGDGNYPKTSTIFQQRAAFGGSLLKPNRINLSQSGDYNNFNTSFPTRDGDAIEFALAARKRQDVQFFVSVEDLIVFTTGGEWRVRGTDDGSLTPASIDAKQQSSYGCDPRIQPMIVQDDIIFVEAKGGTARSIAYDFGSNKYKGVNLSLLAAHLFEGRTVVQMAYAGTPNSTVLLVMSDGAVLSFTYLKEEEVFAWCEHRTDGVFESVAVVAEDDEDVPYFVVRRVIGGVEVKYVERRRSRRIYRADDAFFIDSGLTYEGAATTTISGLDHLAGRLVSGTIDGVPVRDLPVSGGGGVTLPFAGTLVSLGLPYVSELETLDLDVGNVALNGELRNLQKCIVHVERSSGLEYGPGRTAERFEYTPRELEGEVVTDGLFTGKFEAKFDGDWNTNGRMFFQCSLLPVTILAVVPTFDAGGDSEG
jgi:hypothetical protein